MSLSAAVQKLVIDTLKADEAVTDLVGQRIYDRPPMDAAMPFISLGPTSSVVLPSSCAELVDETIQVDVWSSYQGGMSEAKRICDAVRQALHELDTELESGALVEMRIEFIRVFPDADPAVTHGVVSVTAQVEE